MEPELKQFLMEREAVTEEVLHTMMTEKIDMAVIAVMGEEHLKQYIPKLGDRIAVIKYCKASTNLNSTRERRLSLVERIRLSQAEPGNSKSSTKRKSSQEIPDVSKKIDFAPNEKSTRIISVGWIMNGTPIRERNGGGSRTFSISKTARKQDILQKCLELFFPNGTATKRYGSLSQYSYNLLDFKEHIFDENFTVGEMYKMTGLNLLRFYLSTNSIEENWQLIESTKETSKTSKENNSKKKKKKSGKNNISEEKREQGVENECTNLSVNNISDSGLEEFLIFGEFEDSYEKNQNETPKAFEDIVSHPMPNTLFENITVDFPNNVVEQVNSESFSAWKTIVVHRGHIFKELTAAFLNVENMNTFIEIQIIGCNGIREVAHDGGGVLKDALTEYWSEFYDTVCEGSTYKIPEINYMFTEDKWKSVSKVLFVGYNQVKYFPVKLPRAFIEYAISGKACNLVDAYLGVIAPVDADILKKALASFEEVDLEELMESLSNLDCKQLVNKNTIQEIINDLAHTTIIQKPLFILDCWTSVLRNKFSDETLNSVYEKNAVHNKSVLKLIQTFEEELNLDRERVLGFLKKYVREADTDILARFLRFCTGADIITCDYIQVEFNQLQGAARRPVSHTCNNILELPMEYESYRSFKAEFNNILKSEMWSMDIV